MSRPNKALLGAVAIVVVALHVVPDTEVQWLIMILNLDLLPAGMLGKTPAQGVVSFQTEQQGMWKLTSIPSKISAST